MSGIRPVYISGTGAYAPERVVTNKDLEKRVDTTDEWIVTRTGMQERRMAADDEATSDMGAEAARRALDAAGIPAEKVDLIIAATITPDQPWPNTACHIQHKIGAVNAGCFGLEAACSGFLYALDAGRHWVASGAMNTVLVIGAEKMTSILDWEDRSTCVLFGDGAGAAVLTAEGEGQGLISTVLGADGALSHLLGVPAGGSRMPTTEQTVKDHMHFLKMEGRDVYKAAVTKMTAAAKKALEQAQVSSDDVQWVIPHQANLRIIQAVSHRLHIPMERFIVNVAKYGNTSGASVGIALDEAVRDERIKKGDKVLLVVFGGGFTWGATLLEWGT